MKEKNGRCFFRVYVNEDLHDAALQLSHDSGVPVSVVMRRALESWVTTEKIPARVTMTPPQEAGHAEETQTE